MWVPITGAFERAAQGYEARMIADQYPGIRRAEERHYRGSRGEAEMHEPGIA